MVALNKTVSQIALAAAALLATNGVAQAQTVSSVSTAKDGTAIGTSDVTVTPITIQQYRTAIAHPVPQTEKHKVIYVNRGQAFKIEMNAGSAANIDAIVDAALTKYLQQHPAPVGGGVGAPGAGVADQSGYAANIAAAFDAVDTGTDKATVLPATCAPRDMHKGDDGKPVNPNGNHFDKVGGGFVHGNIVQGNECHKNVTVDVNINFDGTGGPAKIILDKGVTQKTIQRGGALAVVDVLARDGAAVTGSIGELRAGNGQQDYGRAAQAGLLQTKVAVDNSNSNTATIPVAGDVVTGTKTTVGGDQIVGTKQVAGGNICNTKVASTAGAGNGGGAATQACSGGQLAASYAGQIVAKDNGIVTPGSDSSVVTGGTAAINSKQANGNGVVDPTTSTAITADRQAVVNTGADSTPRSGDVTTTATATNGQASTAAPACGSDSHCDQTNPTNDKAEVKGPISYNVLPNRPNLGLAKDAPYVLAA